MDEYDNLCNNYDIELFLSSLNDFFKNFKKKHQNILDEDLYLEAIASVNQKFSMIFKDGKSLNLINKRGELFIVNELGTIVLLFEYLKAITIKEDDNKEKQFWSFSDSYTMYFIKKNLKNPSIKNKDGGYLSINSTPELNDLLISPLSIIYDHHSLDEDKLKELFNIIHSENTSFYKNEYIIKFFPHFSQIKKLNNIKINYKIDRFIRLKRCNYAFYNNKIGLTLFLLQKIYNYQDCYHIKCLYLNVNYIFEQSSIINLRNYFYFFVSYFEKDF